MVQNQLRGCVIKCQAGVAATTYGHEEEIYLYFACH